MQYLLDGWFTFQNSNELLGDIFLTISSAYYDGLSCQLNLFFSQDGKTECSLMILSSLHELNIVQLK